MTFLLHLLAPQLLYPPSRRDIPLLCGAPPVTPCTPRSLVRDEQTSPRRPRLVVCGSTCPRLSPWGPAHAKFKREICPVMNDYTHSQISGRRAWRRQSKSVTIRNPAEILSRRAPVYAGPLMGAPRGGCTPILGATLCNGEPCSNPTRTA